MEEIKNTNLINNKDIQSNKTDITTLQEPREKNLNSKIKLKSKDKNPKPEKKQIKEKKNKKIKYKKQTELIT